MVYVPWRLSSLDACHISEEDWTGLRTIVIDALNSSPVGLEGPSVHGQAWDDWFQFLADTVAKKYWPDTDPSAIRRIFRPQVIEMAGVERSKRRAQRAGGSSDSDGGGGSGPPTHNTKQEDEDDVMAQPSTTPPPVEEDNPLANLTITTTTTTETPTRNSAAETPRRGPGRPRKKTPANSPDTAAASGGSRKHHALEDAAIVPVKRARTASASSRAQAAAAAAAAASTSAPTTTTTATFVVPPRRLPPFGLILETRVPPSPKTKIIYASDTPTLQLFLDKVHKKFGLSPDQRATNVEVEMEGGKTYVVDLEDDRDWLAVQEIAKSTGAAMVGVVVDV